ncbi:hypothetical protein D3C73_1226980 [compost metagenome]
MRPPPAVIGFEVSGFPAFFRSLPAVSAVNARSLRSSSPLTWFRRYWKASSTTNSTRSPKPFSSTFAFALSIAWAETSRQVTFFAPYLQAFSVKLPVCEKHSSTVAPSQ